MELYHPWTLKKVSRRSNQIGLSWTQLLLIFFNKQRRESSFSQAATTPIAVGKVVKIAYPLILKLMEWKRPTNKVRKSQLSRKCVRHSRIIFHKHTGATKFARRQPMHPKDTELQKITHKKQNTKRWRQIHFKTSQIKQPNTTRQWQTLPESTWNSQRTWFKFRKLSWHPSKICRHSRIKLIIKNRLMT